MNGVVKLKISDEEYPVPETTVPVKSDGKLNGATSEPDDHLWALPELQEQGVKWSELTTKGKVLRVCTGILKFFILLLLLYLFICSLDFLSSAFRLLGGREASRVMADNDLLKNPIVGLMIGVLATVLVQSSSTSTSIVITMVGSNLINVRNAIPIIMGANIGTSVTNTIVSLSQATDRMQFRRAFAAATVHDMFNWLTVIVLLPIEVATGYLEKLTGAIMSSATWKQNKAHNKEFLTVITKPFTKLIIQLDKSVLNEIATNDSAAQNKSLIKQCCVDDNCKCHFLLQGLSISDAMIGLIMLAIALSMLVLCLILLVKLLHSMLQGRIAITIRKIVNVEPKFPYSILVGYIAIFVGCGLTILVQSSSIFTSALTPLAGIGVISINRMYPLTLGSNIGTTTTGILAALAASDEKLHDTLQIAFCHLFFNISGIVLFYPIPFMRFPIPLAKGLGNTTAKYRWFSIFYLITMFILFPLFVFGISTAGRTVLMAVGIPLLVILALVAVINILQRKRPSLLPMHLRNWNWLPMWMHSLDPLDNVLSKVFGICKCCKCCELMQSRRESKFLGIPPNQSEVNILDSHRASIGDYTKPNGIDNSAFGWKPKSINTKL